VFEYLAKAPDAAAAYDGGMTGLNSTIIPAVIEAYDFSGFRHIVDVAGGQGSLLAAVLDLYFRNSDFDVTLRWGVELLDALAYIREHVQTITPPLLILHGGSDRVANVAGARWLFETAGSKDKKLLIYPDLRHELHNELAADRAGVFADILE
jgi:hypothetical protein